MSSARETGMSSFPIFLESATRLPTCLPTTGIPSVLVFMLTVFILLRLIELYIWSDHVGTCFLRTLPLIN
ncbi:hypothetical protein LINPERHAP1_LOCUS34113 [Linum perenne]